MIEAPNPNEVLHGSRVNIGKEGSIVRVTSQEFAAGTQNILTLLVGRMDLWMIRWVGEIDK